MVVVNVILICAYKVGKLLSLYIFTVTYLNACIHQTSVSGSRKHLGIILELPAVPEQLQSNQRLAMGIIFAWWILGLSPANHTTRPSPARVM